MAYATQAALNAEIAARKAADSSETSLRIAADGTMSLRIAALEDAVKALQPPPVIVPVTTVTVKSIADLYAALAANAPDITLAPGNYSGDIVVDSRFAGRTAPGVVHCDGAVVSGCLRHRGGAHDLDWRSPTFANLTISQTGVIVFGGYAGEPGPSRITIRKPKVLSTVRRTSPDHTTEHAVYFSYATGDWGDILIEDLDVDATDPMGLTTAIHGDHGYPADAPNVTARRVTVRRTVFRGSGTQGAAVQQPLILWSPPFHDWLFDGATITNANGVAVRFESIGASGIVFKDVVSTGSRQGGFYSSLGANPPGVTFSGGSLN